MASPLGLANARLRVSVPHAASSLEAMAVISEIGAAVGAVPSIATFGVDEIAVESRSPPLQPTKMAANVIANKYGRNACTTAPRDSRLVMSANVISIVDHMVADQP